MVESSRAEQNEDSVTPSWRIDPAPSTVVGQLAAMWRYRHLFRPLAVSALFDIYRGTILGVVWMAIRPLVIAIPAIFIVGNLFGISVDPLPLPLFIMVGLGIWILFRFGVQWMTKGLGRGRAILQRVYFPALLLVVAGISPGLFQFLVVMCLVAGMVIYYGPIEGTYYLDSGWHTLAVMPSVLMIILLALAVSCFTAILNVFASDTWLTMRYSLAGWMLATPVVYPIDVIPEAYRWIAYLNPATVPVELFRLGLLGYGGVPLPYLALSVAEILILLICGIWFFARMQARIFDHM